ncbi:MAG: Na/Pi cotransporter family protein [Thiohalobacteraceae bacterium]
MSGTQLLVNFVGGVALLVWAVRMVRTGMMRAFGPQLRRAIGACTTNRVAAAGTGLAATAVLQSSSATALIVSSLAARGLIPAALALAIMLGADVGSALVAQIYAFDLRWLSPLVIAVGVTAFMASRTDRTRHVARIAIGVGLMLLALSLITAASSPLRESPGFAVLLSSLDGDPLLAMLLAALLTWLAHSSLAMILLVMALAGAQALSPSLALALVLGVNIGGAIAPLAVQTSAVAAARRVPLGNLLMRSAGALALVPALPFITDWFAMLGASQGHAVIHTHLAFNLLITVAFLPLIGSVARLCVRILPDNAPVRSAAKPQYLDPALLDTPSEALVCAARECLRLGDMVDHMLQRGMLVLEHGDTRLLKEVSQDDDAVDQLHEAIKLYLIQLSRVHMSHRESDRCMEIIWFTVNLEQIGDIIEQNLMGLAAKKVRHARQFSPEELANIKQIHAQVSDNLQLSLNVLMSRDPHLAQRLLQAKRNLRKLESLAVQAHFDRLRSSSTKTIADSAIYLDVIRDLKRINSHLSRVAYPLIDARPDVAAPSPGQHPREVREAEAPASWQPCPRIAKP